MLSLTAINRYMRSLCTLLQMSSRNYQELVVTSLVFLMCYGSVLMDFLMQRVFMKSNNRNEDSMKFANQLKSLHLLPESCTHSFVRILVLVASRLYTEEVFAIRAGRAR